MLFVSFSPFFVVLLLGVGCFLLVFGFLSCSFGF